jgi:hypothetical protein
MSSDELYMGTTFTVSQQLSTMNSGRAIMFPVHYRDDDLFNAVSKLESSLLRCGVRGISGDAVLRHAIGFSKDPLTLTGLKFNNREKYKQKQMFSVFLRKERDLAAAILKIVFGEADSVARNSGPIALEVVRTELSFNFSTASRQAIVYYKAIDSKPQDTYRVTIRGVGIDSPSTMELECSYEWPEFRYRDLKIIGISMEKVANMPPQVQHDEFRPITYRADFASALVTIEKALVQGFHVDVSPCGVSVLSGNCPRCGLDAQHV